MLAGPLGGGPGAGRPRRSASSRRCPRSCTRPWSRRPAGSARPLTPAYRERRRRDAPRPIAACASRRRTYRQRHRAAAERSRTVQELRVVGVRVELPGNQPILLLKETTASATCRSGSAPSRPPRSPSSSRACRPARPLTHDLLRDVVTRPRRAARGREHHRDARRHLLRRAACSATTGWSAPARRTPIALALRTGAPIFGAEDLLDEVGIEIPDEQEDEVEKFREFLDQISPGGLRRRLGLRRTGAGVRAERP